MDREHGATERVIPRQAIAERVGQRESPLADGDMRAELVLEERGKPRGIGARGRREKRFQVLADDVVENGAGRVAGRVSAGRDRSAVRAARGGLGRRGHAPIS